MISLLMSLQLEEVQPSEFETVMVWFSVGLIIVVGFGLIISRLRDPARKIKRQQRRYKTHQARAFSFDGDGFDTDQGKAYTGSLYQEIKPDPSPSVRFDDDGSSRDTSLTGLLQSRQALAKGTRAKEVYDPRKVTIAALTRLPERAPYAAPIEDYMIPVLFDGNEWHYLPLSPDQCALICGARRMGKGNILQHIALSALQHLPNKLHVWIIDLKQGLDYAFAQHVEHGRLFADAENTDGTLAHGYLQALIEMRRREAILRRAGKRNIFEYNKNNRNPLPFLLLICDEIADLPTAFPEDWADSQPENVAQLMKGGPEGALQSIARLSGASGIILLAATQRPTRDVVSGQIQANTPNRIVFGLSNGKDTQVAFSLGPGEKSNYDPYSIDRPGVAVYRKPGSEVIGIVPEISEHIRDELIKNICRQYPRKSLYTDDEDVWDEEGANYAPIEKVPEKFQAESSNSSQSSKGEFDENMLGTIGTSSEELQEDQIAALRILVEKGWKKTRACKAIKGNYNQLRQQYDVIKASIPTPENE